MSDEKALAERVEREYIEWRRANNAYQAELARGFNVVERGKDEKRARDVYGLTSFDAAPELARAYLDLYEESIKLKCWQDGPATHRLIRQERDSLREQLDAKQKVINAKNRDLDYKLEQLATARAKVERLEADVTMRMDNLDSLTRHWDQLESKWARENERLRGALEEQRARANRLEREVMDSDGGEPTPPEISAALGGEG
jgi:hypothetical protein